MKLNDLFHYVVTESHLTRDEDMNFLEGTISLSHFDENGEEIKIGYSVVYIFEIYDWIEILDQADSISGDVMYVISSLLDTIEAENMHGNIMVIDELYLEKSYDALEYRIFILEKVMNYSNSLNVRNVSFMNEAICKEKELYGEYLNQYINLGFRPILEKGSKHFILTKLNDFL